MIAPSEKKRIEKRKASKIGPQWGTMPTEVGATDLGTKKEKLSHKVGTEIE